MPPEMKCHTCGTPALRRRADKHMTRMVQSITGQNDVWEYLCGQCYPEKVGAFLRGETIRTENKK
jgi:hypothetical protein